HDARDDPRSVDRLDVELDQSVVEQQHRSRPDVVNELLVVEADARRVAELAARVENEPRAGHELDLAFRELADADLRTLEVGHDRDLAALRARDLADELRALDVVGAAAMREVEPHDVDPGREH